MKLHPVGKGMSSRLVVAGAAVLGAAGRSPKMASTVPGVYRAEDIINGNLVL